MIGSCVLSSSARCRYGAIDFREGGTGGRFARRSAMHDSHQKGRLLSENIQILLSTLSYTMTIASFFSSFVVYADAPYSEEEPAKENSDVEAADAEVVVAS